MTKIDTQYETVRIVDVKDSPHYTERAIRYFQQQWAKPHNEIVYTDAITHAVKRQTTMPAWYLLMHHDEIIGCCGVIPNDFISRMDLGPWLCALYVDENYRGNRYSEKLIARVKDDMQKAHYKALYLCTDHIGLYEKYGFSYIGDGYHPWGESSRIYEIPLPPLS